MEIDCLPLLLKHINVRYFYAKNINADLKIDKDGRIYTGNYIVMRLSDSKIRLKDAAVNAFLYNIKLNDERFNKNIVLAGKYFIADAVNPKFISFSTDSDLIIDKKHTLIAARVALALPLKNIFEQDKFFIEGSIENLDLTSIAPYFKFLPKSNILDVGGIINAGAKTTKLNQNGKKHKSEKIEAFVSLADGFILSKDTKEKMQFPKNINLVSEFILSKQLLNINKIKISAQDLAIELDGKIKYAASENPDIDINLTINPTRSEALIALLPSKNFPNLTLNIPKLKEYKLFSDVKGKLKIYGNLKKPLVEGLVDVQNAYIAKRLDIPLATIVLKFKKDFFTADAFVPAGNNQSVTVNGVLDLYDTNDVEFHITSTDSVDLEIAETVLLPLHQILSFPLGPVPVMDIKGVGNIDLKTKGGQYDPHLYGEFKFKNAQVSFEMLKNCIINGGSGSLKFDDQQMYFKSDTAFINSKPISVSGRCSVFGNLDFDVVSKNIELNRLLIMLKTSPMLEVFKKSANPIAAASGTCLFNLNLKGVALDMSDFIIGKNITAKGNIKLNNNAIIISNLKTKINKVAGEIQFNNSDIVFDA